MLVFTEKSFVLMLKNTLLILAAEGKSAFSHRGGKFKANISMSISIST